MDEDDSKVLRTDQAQAVEKTFTVQYVNHDLIKDLFGVPRDSHDSEASQAYSVEMTAVGWVSGEPKPVTAPSHWWQRLWWRVSGRRRSELAEYRRAWRQWDAGGRKPVEVEKKTLIPRAQIQPGDGPGEFMITGWPETRSHRQGGARS